MKAAPQRLIALEGLRGVAAIVVVIYHALYMYWSYMVTGSDPIGSGVQNTAIESAIFATPLFAFISGGFAVAIFFVLSGFVLSIGFFNTGKEVIIQKLASKRYFRLMLPALVSVMFAWLLMSFGLSNIPAVAEASNSIWFSLQWTFSPDFFQALKQGIWSVFATGEAFYNGVLWTMKYEFIGSFLVFCFMLIFSKSEKRGWIYLLLVILTFHTWYLGFVLGVILADLYSKNKFPFHGGGAGLPVLLLILGFFFGGYPVVNPPEGSIYSTLMFSGMSEGQNLSIYTTIGALLIVTSVLTLSWLRSLLAWKYISSLGKYTFAIYLVHLPILFTLTAGLFVWFNGYLSFNYAAALSVIVSIPVIALASYLFERFIDAPSIRASSVFADWFLGLKREVKAKE